MKKTIQSLLIALILGICVVAVSHAGGDKLVGAE